MSVKIYVESLPKEYREKLRERKLTREAVDRLAGQVSEKYLLKKRAFKRAVLICAVSSIVLFVLTLITAFKSGGCGGSITAILFSCMSVAVMEILILAGVYYGAVTRTPRQFAKCLQKGYPELVMSHGYERIVSGELAEEKRSRQLWCQDANIMQK